MNKLKLLRIKQNLTIRELAEKSAYYQDRKEPSIGVILHFESSIRKIEGENVICHKPRKTYEYKNIAQALKCRIEDIYD